MLIVAFWSPDAAGVSPAPTAAAVANTTTASANAFRIFDPPVRARRGYLCVVGIQTKAFDDKASCGAESRSPPEGVTARNAPHATPPSQRRRRPAHRRAQRRSRAPP